MYQQVTLLLRFMLCTSEQQQSYNYKVVDKM